MINVAYGYVLDGLNILICDTENGVQQLRGRLEQRIIEATYKEVNIPENREILDRMIADTLLERGSDVRVEFFIAGKDTIEDVEARIKELDEIHNFKPDVIIWDYIDNFGCSDKRILQKHEKISYNYIQAIQLQAKLNAFGFTASHVNRSGAKEKIYTKETLGGDYAKAANAHAGFAIHATEDEKIAGVGRIYPVFQREGLDYVNDDTTTFLLMQKDRMTIKEISKEEYDSAFIVGSESSSKSDVNFKESNITPKKDNVVVIPPNLMKYKKTDKI
jgi:hypothetical protein